MIKTPLDEFGKPDYECLEALDVKQLNEDLVNLLKEYRDGINKKGSLEKITKTEINYILDAKKMKEKELKEYLQKKYREILE